MKKVNTFRFKEFLGKRSGIKFLLHISENPPTLTNIGSHLDKTESERFYLITSFAESTKLNEYNHFENFVDRNDKITFTQFNT